MIYTTLDDFYLTEEQLTNSPSRKDGVSADLEDQLRRYGCDIIAEACVLLNLPQGVAATGQVLIQRFYCKRSVAKFDVKVASMAAFWLSCKLEEVIEVDSPNKLKLRDILSVFYRVIRRRENKSLTLLDPYSKKYDQLKVAVVRDERHMLRAFGFVVHVEHPHRFVLTFGQLLGLGRDTLQEAWNLANDSLRSTLCLRFKAEIVACGILFAAARRTQTPMPESPPWWELFKVNREEINEVCRTLHRLHALPRAEYVVLGVDWTAAGEERQCNAAVVVKQQLIVQQEAQQQPIAEDVQRQPNEPSVPERRRRSRSRSRERNRRHKSSSRSRERYRQKRSRSRSRSRDRYKASRRGDSRDQKRR